MSQKSDTRPMDALWTKLESNREMTLWMSALFVICGLLLAQEIHHVFLGHFSAPTHVLTNYWSISDKVFMAITAILFFVLAFNFPKKSVKIGFVLMGVNFSVFVLLSCFPVSETIGHVVAVLRSAMRQIALIIFCMAIAQWFKSSTRRLFSREPLDNNSCPRT